MKYYYILEVQFIDNTEKYINSIKSLSLKKFFCKEIEEYTLNEKEVDQILGSDAFVSGIMPKSIISKIENIQNQKKRKLKFFFYNECAKSNAENFSDFLKTEKKLTCSLIEEEWADWNSKWKESYSPIKVSDLINIYPEWHKEKTDIDKKNAIFINPGMGFGTGDHDTTYMCLKAFSEILENGETLTGSILDFGAGSGILGLTAIKLTNCSTTFCDIDKEALDNCLENIVINFEGVDLSSHSLVIREKLDLRPKHQLIFANILKNILILEKDTLYSLLQTDGRLILSGILLDQVDEILKEFSFLKLQEKYTQNGWAALVLKRV